MGTTATKGSSPAEGEAGTRHSRASPDGEEPRLFGPYQLVERIGSGSVGTVYRAHHAHPACSSQNYAVKILSRDTTGEDRVAQLFRQEGYVLAMLQHPNVVGVVETGIEEGTPFIAMEYVAGQNLHHLLHVGRERQQTIPMAVALHVVANILHGLVAAHELVDQRGASLGLVHQDVNPANVFLSYAGDVKLGDFGAALLPRRRGQSLAGTPGYLAPEAINGDAVDQRGDLFGVGVILFELLANQKLFDAPSSEECLRFNERARVPPLAGALPDVPVELRRLLARALSRRPGDRFASAREMRQALVPFLPPPQEMQLGVASLLRVWFRAEHLQELRARTAIAELDPAARRHRLVAVCGDDTPRRRSLCEGLLEQGLWVEVDDSPATLKASLQYGLAPSAAVWDAGCRTFPAERFLEAVAVRSNVPVVAISSEFSLDRVASAYRVGARELIAENADPRQVAAAVHVAASVVETHDSFAEPGAKPMREPLAVLSADATLVDSLREALFDRNWQVVTFSSVDQVLEAFEQRTFAAVLAQLDGGAGRLLVERLRALPGIAFLPVMFLTNETPEIAAAYEQVAERRATEPAVVIASGLDAVAGQQVWSRRYTRFSCRWAATLSTRGREFVGLVLNASRRGIGIRAQVLPRVGARVTIEVDEQVLDGVVRYAEAPAAGSAEIEFGVSISRYEGGEAAWIAKVLALAGK